LEFEFGVNWSAQSRFESNVFAAPLAIERLTSFMFVWFVWGW
jgi:cytochrome bd-type quinol oxidase subunit 1